MMIKKKRIHQKLKKGHYAKAGSPPKKYQVEFRDFRSEFDDKVALGKEINIADVFQVNDFVDAVGTTKGKGFQGVVKRHNFAGVGQAAGPCVVTQVKNVDSDGYRAVQLAYDDKKEKNTSKAEKRALC